MADEPKDLGQKHPPMVGEKNLRKFISGGNFPKRSDQKDEDGPLRK